MSQWHRSAAPYGRGIKGEGTRMAVEFESLQEAAQELGDDVEQHDRAGLEALSEGHLREQSAARDELYDYVDGLWEQAKEAGLDPAVHPRTRLTRRPARKRPARRSGTNARVMTRWKWRRCCGVRRSRSAVKRAVAS